MVVVVWSRWHDCVYFNLVDTLASQFDWKFFFETWHPIPCGLIMVSWTPIPNSWCSSCFALQLPVCSQTLSLALHSSLSAQHFCFFLVNTSLFQLHFFSSTNTFHSAPAMYHPYPASSLQLIFCLFICAKLSGMWSRLYRGGGVDQYGPVLCGTTIASSSYLLSRTSFLLMVWWITPSIILSSLRQPFFSTLSWLNCLASRHAARTHDFENLKDALLYKCFLLQTTSLVVLPHPAVSSIPSLQLLILWTLLLYKMQPNEMAWCKTPCILVPIQDTFHILPCLVKGNRVLWLGEPSGLENGAVYPGPIYVLLEWEQWPP